jgi:hypothetical protein
MRYRGILPGLSMITRLQVRIYNIPSDMDATCLRESTIVPDVSVVGETVAHVTQASLFDVLLDGIERLLLGDLHLSVGPAGNFDDHVQDAVALVCKKWDIVEGG